MHRTQESTYSSELSSHAYLTLAIKPSILKTLAIKPSILWRSSPQTSWRSSPQFSNFMAIKPSILGRSTSKLSPVCFVHQHSHPYGLRDELSWVRVTNVIKCYVMLCYVMLCYAEVGMLLTKKTRLTSEMLSTSQASTPLRWWTFAQKKKLLSKCYQLLYIAVLLDTAAKHNHYW